MRFIRIVAGTGLVALLLTLVAPATSASSRTPTPQLCAAELDCSLTEIEQLTMSDRLDFVRLMTSGAATELLPDRDPGRWRNIEGIVLMFRNNNVGPPRSWASYTDAGILEGVERGLAIASGRSEETGGNPGARLWASYLTRLANGELDNRRDHDLAWSEAEQASTDHGAKVAEEQYGEVPTATESRFFQISEVYRFMLRNRPYTLDLLNGLGQLSPVQQQNFYDWATDVTNADAGRTGAELLWNIADLQAPNATLDIVEVFRAYLSGMYQAYRADSTR
ncbi:hypothetical protein EV191_101656 [Tamaricihabitans halophyticus]|uniref:Uncharacterized protein n=1 Tax=Tamaricihabitans halophyticus TaxID=1262583 RepID=A0A4R2R1X0_9PSEU|nr:hypothetical protein [Tamaricihabitans halophyticus]TCP56710.1 hypothetical protein EV191_101656 [Tamaricihabitans halophyticus]